MGKNKSKKAKGIHPQATGGKVQTNPANPKGVVNSLEDVGILLEKPKIAIKIQPKAPEPPKVTQQVVAAAKKEGYVLETVFQETGTPDYTRVLIMNGDDWDVINCYRPSITMPVGVKIRYVPGSYNNRETVTNPMIVESETILTKLFNFLQKKIEKQGVEETSYFKFAKKFFSMNHVGKNEEEKFENFLAECEIVSIIGLLSKGRWIIQK